MAKSRGKTAGGTELASGFISLGVRYGSAMSQVHRDFAELERGAANAGRRAGAAGGTAIEHGLTQGARRARIKAQAEIDSLEAETVGTKIAAGLGRGIGAAIGAPFLLARKSIHGAKDAVEDFGKEGQKSISSIAGVGGVATTALAGIAPEAAAAAIPLAAVVGAFGAIVKSGSEFGKIKLGLQFKTGLGGSQLQDLMGTITQAGKEVPDTFEHIGDVAGDLTKNMHLTGNSLKTVTEQISMLSKKGGQQVDVEGLGAMKRALGTDANAIPALLDQLYTASTKSGVGINDMIGTLARSAPLLKQFGMDAGQSASLLTQFDEAGIDVNKVIPGLARAFKASAKEGEPFQQFVKENVEQLKKLVAQGDTVGAENLAQKVFGSGIRGGGAALLTAVQNGQLDLDKLGAEGPQQSILANAKKSQGVGDQVTLAKNNIEALLKPYGESLMKNVSKWVGEAASAIAKDGPQVVKNIGHAFSNIRHAMDNVGHAFGNIGHALENVWHAGENVWHALENVWHAGENVWHALENVWHAGENVWHAMENVWHAGENVNDFFRDLPGKILGYLESGLKDLGHLLADKVGGLFSGIHLPSFLGGHASGGDLDGAPGPVGRDSALFWGAKGEHVLTAGDVNAMGGQGGVYAFRRALHRSGGGEVGPDVQAAESMVGTAYSQGARNDCSGMVGRVINSAMGDMGDDTLPNTRTMREWLSARGFKTGIGGPGTISVGWYNHGNAPNDGHAAMTLSDGENAESGGANGVFTVGAGAAGASSSEFDNHMYLPASALYGEGEGGGAGGIGGSRGGRGGRGGSGSAAAAQAKVQRADDAYVAATDRLTKARENEAKVDADPKSKQDAKDKAHEQTLKAAQGQTKAAENLQRATEAQRQAAGKGKGGKDSPFGDPMDAMGQLGDIGASAIGQNLPDGFWNPLDSNLLKDASTLLGFFGGLTGNPGLSVAGAAMSGKPSAITGALKGIGQPEFSPLRGAPTPDTQIPQGLTPWNFDPAGPINTAPSAGMGEGGPDGGIGGAMGSMLYASQPPGEKPAKPGKLPFEHHSIAGQAMQGPNGPMGQRGDLGKPAGDNTNNVDQSNSHNVTINAPNQDPDQIARQQASAKVAANRTMSGQRFHMAGHAN